MLFLKVEIRQKKYGNFFNEVLVHSYLVCAPSVGVFGPLVRLSGSFLSYRNPTKND